MMEEQEVGRVSHYFGKLSVAVIELKATLAVGDTIVIKGTATDFEQLVDSMQINQQQVEKVEAGEAVGIKVKEKARVGDKVYKKIT